MFEGKKMTKVEKFKNELESKLLEVSTVSNKGVLMYTYANGHIPQHAVDLLKLMKKQGKLDYEGKSPFLNYENVFRKHNIVNYKIIKK